MSKPVKFSDLFEPLGDGRAELDALTKSIQTLSRNTKTFATNLEGNSQRIAAGLAAILSQSAGLREQTTQLNLLNERERQGLAALQTQVAQLVREQQRLKDAQEAQAKAQQVVNDATKQAQTAYRALQNELREAYKAQDTARIERAALAIRQARTETASLSAALRGTNTELTAARGSYDALDAQNKRLIATLKGLEGGIEGSEEKAAALQAQIAQNTAKLQEFDSRILVFTRNVGNYKGGFSELVAELAKARAAQEGMTKGTADFTQQQLRIAGFQTAAQKAAAQMGLSYEQAEAKINGAGEALRPLATTLVRLEREQLNLAGTTGTESEEYRKLGFQIQSAKKQLDDVAVSTTAAETKQGGLTQQLGFTRDGLNQYAAGLAASTLGIGALIEASKAVFAANVEYSRELAEVRKTTGLTADEADRLAESLKALDTPTTMAGLLKIASVGGQLGIAKDDLLEFTKAIDVASQALSNDFQGGAEEIATVLGKLSTVYRRELGPDVAQNILAIGSAINQISADGSATAPFLASVAKDVGAISASANIGLNNVLAYAAVLEETGSTADVAGTSLNRLFSTLTTRTKAAYEIAKLANPALTLKEFTHLVNTDFNQAIQVFLQGLNAGGKASTDQGRLLATLKLQTGEARNAIITLAQNTELFAERQKTANEQLRESTSLAKEAAINTDTLAGEVDTLKNNASELVTGGALGAILKYLVAFVAFDFKLLGAGFKAIGDGFVYVAEKAGLIDKPLTDYTKSLVDNALTSRKSAAANQELLNSYVQLQNTSTRTTEQELALQQARAKLLEKFGTEEVSAIQLRINKQDLLAQGTADNFRFEIKQYDELIAKIRERQVAAQQAVNEAPRNAEGVISTLAGQRATEALSQAEKELTEQQRQRALAVAALAKLGPGATQQKQADANATDAEAAAEEQLDRAAQQRAKNRVSELQDELAANQQRITAARAYQAEQGKLFADHNLDSERFAEAVRGSEDLISQYERDGAALRIRIVRAESAEKLTEADNDRIRQGQKKKITAAELADIQEQYSLRTQEIARHESVEILKIQDELRQKLETKPLEFKVAQFDPSKFMVNTPRTKTYEDELERIKNAQQAADSELTGQLARRELTESQYDTRRRANRQKTDDAILALDKKFHKATLDDQQQANEDALDDEKAATEKRLALIDKAGTYAQSVESAFYQIKGNFIDAQIQQENAAYENELKVAGDNAKLKEQIEAAHQKRLAKLNYDKAKAERDQALFSIAISTAVAVAKDVATYGFFASLPAVAGDLLLGGLQAAVVLSKPLPAYFKGRAGGPAETALVGERGAELIGQPKTGYRLASKPTVVQLREHDVVHTATETRTILAQNELVEGRLVQRAQQTDMERQTTRLRTGHRAQQEAEAQAWRQSNAEVLAELRQVRRAIKEQEYYRLNEQDDLVRRLHQEHGQRDYVNRRFRPGRG